MKIMSPDFITEAAISNTKKLKVLIVGAGGTGSELASKLLKMHITMKALGGAGLDLTIMDDDVVSPSNVGRQNFYGFDVNQPKAAVIVNRFNNFAGTDWKASIRKFDQRLKLDNCLVFGCVDNAKGRIAIHDSFVNSRNVVWVDSGNDASSANVFMGVNAAIGGKQTYIPSIYDLFESQLKSSMNVTEHEPSCSTSEAIIRQDAGINDCAAQHASQFLWQLYRHGEIAYHGVTVNLKTGTSSPIEADPQIWEMFGYKSKGQRKKVA